MDKTTNNMKNVGQRIREARKNKRLSQNELAEMAQISPSHMSDIENGKTSRDVSGFEAC